MSQKANREIALGITIIVLTAIGAFIAIPAGIVMPENIGVLALAPNFWPLVVVAMAGLAGVAIAVHGIADLRQSGHVEVTPMLSDDYPVDIDGDERPFLEALTRVAITISVLFALYFAIPWAGIVLSSSAVLVFLTFFAGERRWRIILPVAVLLPLLLYVFFVHIANVPMPLGVFEAFR